MISHSPQPTAHSRGMKMSPRGALCFVAGAFLRRQQCGAPNDCEIVLPIEPTPRNAPARATSTHGFKRIGCWPIESLLRRERTSLVTPQMGSAAVSVWVVNDEEETIRCIPGSPPASPQGFLLAHPPGPYTCIRTVGNRSVAMLPFHLARLWESACATGLGSAVRLEGRQSLGRRTTDAITKAAKAFVLANANVDGGCPECMITVLYTHRRPDREDESTENNVVEDHRHDAVEAAALGAAVGGGSGEAAAEGGGAVAAAARAGAAPSPAAAASPPAAAVAAAATAATTTTTTATTTSTPSTRTSPPTAATAAEVAAETGRGEDGRNVIILAHAWPLRSPTAAPGGPMLGPRLEVLVAGVGRSLPEAKHSSWLRDRRHLDDLKAQAGAQEVVLSEADRSEEGSSRKLLEGLTSNFFVVGEDGAVCTAPSGEVLAGSMRQLVISSCGQEDIPLRFEPPDLAEAGRWKEAFLTGTGRILAPISVLLIPTENSDIASGDSTRSSPNLSVSRLELRSSSGVDGVAGGEGGARLVAERLRSRVVSHLENGATRLF